ncbi:MAG: hypothetical protein Q8R20_00525, partial [Nanoarchaeota archaeon]|nr:hypothetical protein [Nanoarchaeota archaeon]
MFAYIFQKQSPPSRKVLEGFFEKECAVFEAIKWNEQGLVPVIIQDAENNDILMMAWMNENAIRRT